MIQRCGYFNNIVKIFYLDLVETLPEKLLNRKQKDLNLCKKNILVFQHEYIRFIS